MEQEQKAPSLVEAAKRFCDPAKLREAVMMEGVHLSHHQACRIIEEDRLGLSAAIAAHEQQQNELLAATKAYRKAFGNCGAPFQQATADALDAAIAKAEGR